MNYWPSGARNPSERPALWLLFSKVNGNSYWAWVSRALWSSLPSATSGLVAGCLWVQRGQSEKVLAIKCKTFPFIYEKCQMGRNCGLGLLQNERFLPIIKLLNLHYKDWGPCNNFSSFWISKKASFLRWANWKWGEGGQTGTSKPQTLWDSHRHGIFKVSLNEFSPNGAQGA